jgi:signal recognition particle GTPase
MDLDSWRRAWELLRTLDEAQLPEPETRDWQSLGDPFQLLFVTIILRHVEELLRATASSATRPRPLRLMLLGTAGTGKTTSMVARILKLVFHDRIPPGAIVATTFTKKAAEELRSRLKQLFGQPTLA